MKVLVAFLAILALVRGFETPELDMDNFDELTDGKTVFLLFYAPWCPHSKRVLPDFRTFAEKWADDPVGFAGQVDCAARKNKVLCDEHGVRGYPQFKWGDPSHLQNYQGLNDEDSLSEFAKEHLKPMCNAANLDLCDGEIRAELERIMAMSDEELDAEIKEEEDKIAAIEDRYRETVAKLQARYHEILSDKDVNIMEVREAGLGTLRSVRAFKEKELFKDEL